VCGCVDLSPARLVISSVTFVCSVPMVSFPLQLALLLLESIKMAMDSSELDLMVTLDAYGWLLYLVIWSVHPASRFSFLGATTCLEAETIPDQSRLVVSLV
jgi:hypothetical protein